MFTVLVNAAYPTMPQELAVEYPAAFVYGVNHRSEMIPFRGPPATSVKDLPHPLIWIGIPHGKALALGGVPLDTFVGSPNTFSTISTMAQVKKAITIATTPLPAPVRDDRAQQTAAWQAILNEPPPVYLPIGV